jgi:hypothetical protein
MNAPTAAGDLARQGMAPEAALLQVIERVVAMTERRRLDDRGRPHLDLEFYALSKDGRVAGASAYQGGRYAAADAAAGARGGARVPVPARGAARAAPGGAAVARAARATPSRARAAERFLLLAGAGAAGARGVATPDRIAGRGSAGRAPSPASTHPPAPAGMPRSRTLVLLAAPALLPTDTARPAPPRGP